MQLGEVHGEVQKLKNKIVVEGDFIIIKWRDHPPYYEIPLKDCETQEQIFAWTYKLTEKAGWMDLSLLRYFIEFAHTINKLELQHPPQAATGKL